MRKLKNKIKRFFSKKLSDTEIYWIKKDKYCEKYLSMYTCRFVSLEYLTIKYELIVDLINKKTGKTTQLTLSCYDSKKNISPTACGRLYCLWDKVDIFDNINKLDESKYYGLHNALSKMIDRVNPYWKFGGITSFNYYGDKHA